MPHNGSCPPEMRPSSTNNDAYSVNHNDNNYETNLAYPNGQNFDVPDETSYAVTPINAELPHHIAGWPIAHQVPLLYSEPVQGLDMDEAPSASGNGVSFVPNSFAQQESSHVENSALGYALSPSPLLHSASSWATRVVDNNMGYQDHLSSLSTAGIAAPENENSPPYQCLDCPNMPTFANERDLQRHRDSTILHWNENTRFYQCCCAAYRTRKDNHRRHVLKCKGPALTSYACDCGIDIWERDEHLEHIRHCGSARRH